MYRNGTYKKAVFPNDMFNLSRQMLFAFAKKAHSLFHEENYIECLITVESKPSVFPPYKLSTLHTKIWKKAARPTDRLSTHPPN